MPAPSARTRRWTRALGWTGATALILPLLACGACRRDVRHVTPPIGPSAASVEALQLTIDVPTPVVVDRWVPPRAWRPVVQRPLAALDVVVLDPRARILWRGTTSMDGRVERDPAWPSDATLVVRAAVPDLGISVVDCTYARCALLANTWAHGWTLAEVDATGHAGIGRHDVSAGAFAIVLTLAEAARRTEGALGIALPPLVARWMHGEGTSCGTTCFIEGGSEVDAIEVLGQEGDSDHFDADILAHEFGHFVHSALAGADDNGGYHDGTPTAPTLAWSEGFATWFAVSVTGDRVYVDSHRDGGAWYDYGGTTAMAQPQMAPTQDLSEDLVVELLLEVSADGSASGFSGLLALLQSDALADRVVGRSVTGLDLIDVLDGWSCTEPGRAAAIDQAASSRGLRLDAAGRRCDASLPLGVPPARPSRPAQSPISATWVAVAPSVGAASAAVTVEANARLLSALLEIHLHRADGSRELVERHALGAMAPGSLVRVPVSALGSDGLVEARLAFTLPGGSTAVFSTSMALDGRDAGEWPVTDSTVFEIGGLGRHRVNVW